MPHTVLVADDDPVMHDLMEHYLERAGYQMITANNGRAAIEIAERELPQLILLDVMMPEMGGLAALKRLKETEATRAIPVIIVTVHTDTTTRQECMESGAAAFVAKPIHWPDLLAELKRLLPPNEAGGGVAKAGQ